MSEVTKHSYQRLINKTEDYIEQHLADAVTLTELAANVHMSPFHFHRVFKTYSDETLKEFVTRFKLERAAIYLALVSDVSLTTIAFNYGYHDASTFSRAFKRYFGVSPSQYRKQQEMTSMSKNDRL